MKYQYPYNLSLWLNKKTKEWKIFSFYKRCNEDLYFTSIHDHTNIRANYITVKYLNRYAEEADFD